MFLGALILLYSLTSGALAQGAELTLSEATPQAPCRQLSPTTFLIDGPTDRKMLECVRANLGDNTTQLTVKSGGGSAEAAMDIADRIARPGLTIRVQDKCYSSCANYLIPLASKLIVDPAATIVVHGGIDPLFQSRHAAEQPKKIKEMMKLRPNLTKAQAEAEFAQSVASLQRLAERQKAFARKHNIRLGWLIYREQGDSDFGRFLVGDAGPKPHPFGWGLMLVEEPMLTSCLPAVQVVPFQAQLEKHFINNPKRYNVFRKAEGRRSLSLRCSERA